MPCIFAERNKGYQIGEKFVIKDYGDSHVDFQVKTTIFHKSTFFIKSVFWSKFNIGYFDFKFLSPIFRQKFKIKTTGMSEKMIFEQN